MHVIRGLRQAAVMLLLAAAVSLAVAGVWLALSGGGLRNKIGIVGMVVAALLSITGGTELSRSMTTDARAFLGAGPEREDPDSGSSLTPVGVFLFVSVPLFLLAATVYGRAG